MPKITRANQKIFGSLSGANEIATFGSLAAGSPAFTVDPDVIQSLNNYLGGWFSAVIGANSPAIEDMNAICFLFARQLAYLYQTGVPEWNASTVYYTGSLATDSSGMIYVSLINDNTNGALSDPSKWRSASGLNTVAIDPGATPTRTLVAADNGKVFYVNTNNGVFSLTLPSASISGFQFTVKDTAGKASVSPIGILQAGGALIENLNSSYSCAADYGSWSFFSTGTAWFIN